MELPDLTARRGKDGPLTPVDGHVIVSMLKLGDNATGVCEASIEEIAERACCSRPSVKRTRRKLLAAGCIALEHYPQGARLPMGGEPPISCPFSAGS